MNRPSLSMSLRAGAAVGALALVTTALTALPAAAATDPCPAAAPAASIPAGTAVNGLTVEKGVAPDPFTGTVLGRIVDGIAPGIDMIIVEADSPAIQRAQGIWAGMSGSPVYTADGLLVGAVAYGLSFGPSPIAGVTPAEDMQELLALGATAPVAPARTVAVPKAIANRIVATGEVTAAQAANGLKFTQLPMPLRITGVGAKRAEQVTDKFPRLKGAVVGTNAGATTSAATASDLVPGGNLAATLSYGDITAGGVGTVTAVCAAGILGFGHPFTWQGRFTGGLHPAEAVYVQPDVTLTPFKVANFGPIVGTIDQDRLAGIRGKVGTLPAETLVSSSISSLETGKSRDGETRVTVHDFVPDLGATHVLFNFDVVADFIKGGTSNIYYRIEGTRTSGAPFSVERTDRMASEFDVSFLTSFLLFDDLATLVYNDQEKIRITDVSVEADVDDQYTDYRIEAVSYRTPAGIWRPLQQGDQLTAVAGGKLNLRVKLRPFQQQTTVTKLLQVPVPAGTQGGFGELTVSGVDIFGGEGGEGAAAVDDFDDILAAIEARPTHDSVVGRLNVFREDGPTPTVKSSTGATKTGQIVFGQQFFQVQVVAPRPARAGYVSGTTWRLRPNMSPGPATQTFTFGPSVPFTALMGDWDGDGTLTPAAFRNGTWRVQRTSSPASRTTFTFGQPGDLAVVGDWDGDGRDSIGVNRWGRWLLRNEANAGPAQLDFFFGGSGKRVVSGDWDGDGDDTVGVFSAGAWRLLADNAAGAAVRSATFGRAGDRPVMGDWDRDGDDEIGVYRAGTWLLRTTATTGPAQVVFRFGTAAARPVVG